MHRRRRTRFTNPARARAALAAFTLVGSIVGVTLHLLDGATSLNDMVRSWVYGSLAGSTLGLTVIVCLVVSCPDRIRP